MPLASTLQTEDEPALRAGAEEICAQLCAAVTGNFDFHVDIQSTDETVQKLAMLANFVLDAARRAVDAAAARAAAERRAEELRDAHRIARIGTWRWDLVRGTLHLSDELYLLLGLACDRPLRSHPAPEPPGQAGDVFVLAGASRTDVRPDRAAPQPTARSLLAIVHPQDRRAACAALARRARREDNVEHEWRVVRPDGSFAWFWAETTLERSDTGEPLAVRGVCQDVTEDRAATERIRQLAHHDPLTGLANRALLQDRLANAVASSRRTSDRLALLCLDLDGFKAVNDGHGHGVGDELLRTVAARLVSQVREVDTVARLGGDEFVVLQLAAGPEEARALTDRFVAALHEPCSLSDGRIQSIVTASVGVALFPADGHDAETLLRNADTAMYRAKWAGKDRVAFFHPEMDARLRERWALERDLRQALAWDEFSLVWQPISRAEPDGEIVGFEALLRWRHASRGLIPPEEFIPVAEACGAITAIGTWVLREACREAARWTAPLQVAVNVSPIQAQQGDVFAELVEQVLADTGLAPSRLILEVTEGVMIRDAERVLSALRRLKASGVRFALDDFGTGYSSLATLRAFPFDKLKIDRSFVRGVADPASDQDIAIVQAVLGLARGLSLPVVAEGVETRAQLRALRQAGCEEVQGWLIGRPQPIETHAHLTGVREGALGGTER